MLWDGKKRPTTNFYGSWLKSSKTSTSRASPSRSGNWGSTTSVEPNSYSTHAQLELRTWEWHYLKRLCRGRVPPLRHAAAVFFVAISRSGEVLASSDIEGGVTLWDGRSYQKLRHIPAHKRPVWSLAFSHDGGCLASASEDGTVKTWAVPTGKQLLELPGNGRGVFSVSLSPDGRLASLGDAGLTLWDVATGKRLSSFHG